MTKKLKTLLAIGFLTLASCEDNKTTTTPKLDTKIYTELVTMFDDKYDKIKIKGDPSTFNKFDDTYSFIVEVTNVHPSEHGWKVGDKLKVQATKTEDGWTNQKWFFHRDRDDAIPPKGRLPVTKPPITNLVPDGKEVPKEELEGNPNMALPYEYVIKKIDEMDDYWKRKLGYMIMFVGLSGDDDIRCVKNANNTYTYYHNAVVVSLTEKFGGRNRSSLDRRGWFPGGIIEFAFDTIEGKITNPRYETILKVDIATYEKNEAIKKEKERLADVKKNTPKWITGGAVSLTYKNHINDVIDAAVRHSKHISSVTKLYDTYSVMRLAKGHYKYKCKIHIKSNAKGTSASIDKLIEEKGWGVGATIEMTFEKINGQLKNTSIATIDKR